MARGAPPPLSVGQSWTIHFTLTCNADAPIDYAQEGSSMDLETVTVPGGTFSALKLQSTITWTDLHGTAHTETDTNWVDIATFHSVKQSITYVDSGTLPVNGYAVSREIVLESSS